MRGHAHGEAVVDRLANHLKANDVDLDDDGFLLGPWLEVAASGESIASVSSGGSETLAQAKKLARGHHRDGYGFAGL